MYLGIYIYFFTNQANKNMIVILIINLNGLVNLQDIKWYQFQEPKHHQSFFLFVIVSLYDVFSLWLDRLYNFLHDFTISSTILQFPPLCYM